MILVVDANILFAALVRNGTTRRLLLISPHDFYAPEYSIEEFKKHIGELRAKTGLAEKELSGLLDEITETAGIKLVPFEDFRGKEQEAKSVSPDPDDAAYLALALHLGCAIWSNDAGLKNQDRVKILTTKELLEEMGTA